MYRPHKPRGFSQPSTVELPPSYESLFMSESPPSYNVAASEAETDEQMQQSLEEALEAATSEVNTAQNSENSDSSEAHCQCDCDHSKCLNASK